LEEIMANSFSAIFKEWGPDTKEPACLRPGKTVADFRAQYESLQRAKNLEYRLEAPFAADTVCLMVLAFNEMLKEVGESNFNQLFFMDKARYDKWCSIVQDIKFQGISGYVNFSAGGARKFMGGDNRATDFWIKQIHGNAQFKVGEVTVIRMVFNETILQWNFSSGETSLRFF
jgi:hypothetical protein